MAPASVRHSTEIFSCTKSVEKMLTNLTNNASAAFRALKQLSTRSEKCQSKKRPRRAVSCKQLEQLQRTLAFKFKPGVHFFYVNLSVIPTHNTFGSNTQLSQSTWTGYLPGKTQPNDAVQQAHQTTTSRHRVHTTRMETEMLKGRQQGHHIFSMNHFTLQIHSCYSTYWCRQSSAPTEPLFHSPQGWAPAHLSCN